MAWNIEVTDTFAGEANYCWVRRYTVSSFANDTQRKVMRKAKAAAGFAGHKGETVRHGDGYMFHPRGMCVVVFVMWCDEDYRFDAED